jgi:hypothetical protein
MDNQTAVMQKDNKSSIVQRNEFPFFKSVVMPKLQVNEPGDQYEREADNVADQVMRMANPSGNGDAFFKPAPTTVQRKCQHCEEEEKLHRKESSGAQTQGSHELDSYVGSLGSSGHALPESSRQFFEPRFGHDFSNVRLHTDSVAAKSAQSINALAYTTGNNIVFNNGQYAPDSDSGKRLMAHELTHVLQQNGNVQPKKIQRAAGFDIKGINPNTAGSTNVIFFDMGSSTINAIESPKIAPLAIPPTSNLTLTGTASEDEPPAVINKRISEVDTALKNAGHTTGIRTPNPVLGAGAGNMDYRAVRAVEVIPTPVVVPPGGVQPASTPPCAVTATNLTPEVAACGTSFIDSFPIGQKWIEETIKKITANDPAALAQISLLFSGITKKDILDHLNVNILPKYKGLPGRLHCHNQCDGGCSRPAYNDGNLDHMVVCAPGFITNPSKESRAETLVHENLHATPVLKTVDTAYFTTRLITSLKGNKSLHNTDSWVLMIMRLGGAPAANIVSPPADTFASMTSGAGSEAAFSKTALSFLEQWLLTAEFDSSLLYNAVNKNIGHVGGWPTADNWSALGVRKLSPIFGLTNPGPASSFPNAPVLDDKVKLAGIFDRYTTMRKAVYTVPITITKDDTISEAWAPALGNSVAVHHTFFTLGKKAAVLRLIELMAGAMSDIPTALEKPYAEGANQLRLNRGGIGP